MIPFFGGKRRWPFRFGKERDRKSTRLNSSHSQISYAVFCLKKKNRCFPPPHPHRTQLSAVHRASIVLRQLQSYEQRLSSNHQDAPIASHASTDEYQDLDAI